MASDLELIPDPQSTKVWFNFRRILEWAKLIVAEIDGGGP